MKRIFRVSELRSSKFALGWRCRRNGTAVFFFDDPGGNRLEVLRIVIDRTTERNFGFGCGLALAGGGFGRWCERRGHIEKCLRG